MSTALLLAAELRRTAEFADLPEDALEWLVAHMQLVELEPGECFSMPALPADRMFVMLEGEVRLQAEGGAR